MSTESNEPSGSQPCSALVMTFKVEGAGKTIQGKMTVPNDDGTSHLPMMIHGLLTQLAESVPQVCAARSLAIAASFDALEPDAARCDALEHAQACFMEWIKLIELELGIADEQFQASETAAAAGDINGFGTALGKAHGHTQNALELVRSATQRGFTEPSEESGNAVQTYTDTQRLDWLDAHPLTTEIRGGAEDGHAGTAWAVAAHSGTLRDTIDALMGAADAEGSNGNE